MIMSPLSIMLECVMLVFTVISCPSFAFRWESDDILHVSGCADSSLSLPWHYLTQAGETTNGISWFQGDQLPIASLSQGTFLASSGGNRQRLAAAAGSNAGLTFDPARLQDNGFYQVQVTVLSATWKAKAKDGKEKADVGKTTFVSSALLVVAQPAVTVNDSVHVQEVTSGDYCSDQERVTLSRGFFSTRGYPPVDVVWTDPAGQILPSSRFQDGYFYLDLPRRSLPGNYTSHVTLQPPMRQCIPADSPLLSILRVHVGKGQCGEEVKNVEDEEQIMDFEELLHNVTDLQGSVSVLQQRLDTAQDASLQALVVEMLQRHGEDIMSLRSTVAALENRTESLNSQLKTAESTAIALKLKNVAMETELQNIRSNDLQSANAIDALRDNLNSTGQKLTVDISAVNLTVTGLQLALTPGCPESWAKFENYCYHLINDSLTFDQAEARCSSLKASLTSIRNDRENRFVKNLDKANHLWIGLHDRNNDSVWTWSNSIGSDVTQVSYTSWARGQPQPNEEYCAVLIGGDSYQWHDYSCDTKFKSVCKRSRVQDTPKVFSDIAVLQQKVTSLEAKHTCPQNWKARGNFCYIYQSSERTWDIAQSFCKTTWDANLVTIDGEDENNFVKQLAPGADVWLGLTDKLQEGIWRWVDTPHLSYTNWDANEPNNEDVGEHCVELRAGNGLWNDIPCAASHTFVCKKRA